MARVAARATKIHFGQIDFQSAAALETALSWAKNETSDRVERPFFDKQKGLNGDIFGEVL